MKVVIITQDDPFYLSNALEKLIRLSETRHEIVGCILLSASPFGKKENFFLKAFKTFRIFGFVFFLKYTIQYVFSKVIRPRGVAGVFESKGIPVLRLGESINHPDSLDQIKKLAPDLLVSIAGNEIFKKLLIELAPKGCINLHTALLPKYRGLMPTFWVLKNREPHTGVSVFLVDEGIDSGPIISQVKVEIGSMSQKQLIKKTKDIGMVCIVDAMDKLAADTPIFLENNAQNATYFGFPTRQDVRAFKAAGARFF